MRVYALGVEQGHQSAVSTRAVSSQLVGRNESDSMRAIYDTHLFPKLQPHQRVAVVPGLVSCACNTDIADGFCEGQVCMPSPTSNNDSLTRIVAIAR